MDLSTVGEFALIARLTRGLQAGPGVVMGVGDDCALLDLGSEQLLLATCDSQVEGVHFKLQISSPEQIGRKALAVNLSDIAAMGGTPRYALVSLLLPAHLPLMVLEGVYAGLRAEAEQYGTAIVGGNVAGAGRSELLVIDITLLGTVERGHVLRRDGARVGDIVMVSGSLGDAAAGLSTFLHEDLPIVVPERLQTACRTPQPRVREGQVLGLLAPEIVTAMLDLSDGLSGDLRHLCERSGVGVRIEQARLPLSDEMRGLAQVLRRDPMQWALHGGEDYELLFTVSPPHVSAVIEAVRRASGTPVTPIGTILPFDQGMQLVTEGGELLALEAESWDHLRAE